MIRHTNGGGKQSNYGLPIGTLLCVQFPCSPCTSVFTVKRQDNILGFLFALAHNARDANKSTILYTKRGSREAGGFICSRLGVYGAVASWIYMQMVCTNLPCNVTIAQPEFALQDPDPTTSV